MPSSSFAKIRKWAVSTAANVFLKGKQEDMMRWHSGCSTSKLSHKAVRVVSVHNGRQRTRFLAAKCRKTNNATGCNPTRERHLMKSNTFHTNYNAVIVARTARAGKERA